MVLGIVAKAIAEMQRGVAKLEPDGMLVRRGLGAGDARALAAALMANLGIGHRASRIAHRASRIGSMGKQAEIRQNHAKNT
jgi:hypothetical protein